MPIFSSIGKRFRAIRRYNQIIRVLAYYGFEDMVGYLQENRRMGFLLKLVPKSSKKRAVQHTKYERMRLVCEELGPTFVKFGQILSNRPDVIPLDLIFEFEKLQDRVPPMPEEDARRVVEEELKGKVEDLFAWFDPKPFASASMAQVHKATLKSGERVVLKIQRPGIAEIIEEDIGVMYKVAAILEERIPSVRSFDPIGLVQNFEKSIIKELDFIHESINIQRFRANLEADKDPEQFATAPLVYQEFTTSKVLTMELIEGVKINRVRKLEQININPKVIARRLAQSYFKQIFEYGFFHADPHPGNLIVLPNGKICYLDFGMMGSILNKDLEVFGNLFLSITRRDVKKIIKSLQILSEQSSIPNMRDLEFDINELVQKYYVRDVHANELSTVLLELKDIIVKHGLKVPSHFYLLARSMVTAEGVIMHLDKNLDQFALVKPYLIKAVARKFNPFKIAKKIGNTFYELGNYMEDFPQDLRNAIRKINSGELKVDLRHKGIDPLVHTMTRVTKQLVTALIVSALIIASTLFIIFDIPPFWGETPAFSWVGFILSGVLLFGMLRDIRKGDHDDWKGWKRDR